MSARYAIYCRDKAGSAPIRKRDLQAHFRYIESIEEHICVAGPLKNASGETVGSLFILSAESETHARQLLEADPYFSADIWDKKTIEIHAFTAAAGAWIGGKIW